MLSKCPECELPLSDKAITCPHCGYPLKPSNITQTKPRSHTHKRLPNGFGQISEIKGQNLRNRFRAMITVGKDENGRPICKTLKPQGYFATYNEAYQALLEYNKSPYELYSNITMDSLFKRWSEEHKKTLKTPGSQSALDTIWSYCTNIHSLKVSEVRIKHMKACIEDAKLEISPDETRLASAITKKRIKEVFNMMFDYALEYEMTDKNYARMFKLSSEISKETATKHPHINFTDVEMEMLWQSLDVYENIDMILIECYSGWRPQELINLRLENINLEERSMTGGMKTKAGTNRKIPINSRIYDLVKKRYEIAKLKGSEYLFYKTTNPRAYMPYNTYAAVFDRLIDKVGLNPNHRPHDCRVQFVTMMKNAGADEYAIKYITGHSISDITEKIYTKRPFDWLREEIDKI